MAKLGNPQNTIEVLQKYGFQFQKKFGLTPKKFSMLKKEVTENC